MRPPPRLTSPVSWPVPAGVADRRVPGSSGARRPRHPSGCRVCSVVGSWARLPWTWPRCRFGQSLRCSVSASCFAERPWYLCPGCYRRTHATRPLVTAGHSAIHRHAGRNQPSPPGFTEVSVQASHRPASPRRVCKLHTVRPSLPLRPSPKAAAPVHPHSCPVHPHSRPWPPAQLPLATRTGLNFGKKAPTEW